MYQVLLTNNAKKDLKKIAGPYLPKVSQAIDALETDPFLGEKMSGKHKDEYRIKIPPLRIIYTINHKTRTITILALGHRGGIYK